HIAASRRGQEIPARQMQEYRAAPAGDARRAVVIDLDNEIIEMVVAPEPIAALLAIQPHRLVVMPARRVFTPGILGPDSANRKECERPRMAVGPPPQSPWPEGAFRCSVIAFALVGLDAAASERHRHRSPSGREPAAAGVAGGGANSDRR